MFFCTSGALDRQHPGDFYDVKMLLDNDGITDDIRKAFVVYLASHSRPMSELLNPNWKDITDIFKREFAGMTREPIQIEELLVARDRMLKTIKRDLSAEDRQFLLSIKEGNPDWTALGIKNLDQLPGLQWKIANIRKMTATKRQDALEKLKAVLD